MQNLQLRRLSSTANKLPSSKPSLDKPATKHRQLWPIRTALPRLDYIENSWWERTRRHEFVHKPSGTRIQLLGLLPFSVIGLHQVESIVKSSKPSAVLTAQHSESDLSIYANYLSHFYANVEWNNSPALIKKSSEHMADLDKHGIRKQAYLPMIAMGIPYMADILTVDKLQSNPKIVSIRPDASQTTIPSWASKVDEALSSIFLRKMAEQFKDVNRQQRSLAQMIRRNHVNFRGINSLPKWIDYVESITVVFKPEEVQANDALTRKWRPMDYLYKIKRPATYAVDKIIDYCKNSKHNEKDADKSILVLADRSLIYPMEALLKQNTAISHTLKIS